MSNIKIKFWFDKDGEYGQKNNVYYSQDDGCTWEYLFNAGIGEQGPQGPSGANGKTPKITEATGLMEVDGEIREVPITVTEEEETDTNYKFNFDFGKIIPDIELKFDEETKKWYWYIDGEQSKAPVTGIQKDVVGEFTNIGGTGTAAARLETINPETGQPYYLLTIENLKGESGREIVIEAVTTEDNNVKLQWMYNDSLTPIGEVELVQGKDYQAGRLMNTRQVDNKVELESTLQAGRLIELNEETGEIKSKLQAGDNITIDEETGVISASGGGEDLPKENHKLIYAKNNEFIARENLLLSDNFCYCEGKDVINIKNYIASIRRNNFVIYAITNGYYKKYVGGPSSQSADNYIWTELNVSSTTFYEEIIETIGSRYYYNTFTRELFYFNGSKFILLCKDRDYISYFTCNSIELVFRDQYNKEYYVNKIKHDTYGFEYVYLNRGLLGLNNDIQKSGVITLEYTNTQRAVDSYVEFLTLNATKGSLEYEITVTQNNEDKKYNLFAVYDTPSKCIFGIFHNSPFTFINKSEFENPAYDGSLYSYIKIPIDFVGIIKIKAIKRNSNYVSNKAWYTIANQTKNWFNTSGASGESYSATDYIGTTRGYDFPTDKPTMVQKVAFVDFVEEFGVLNIGDKIPNDMVFNKLIYDLLERVETLEEKIRNIENRLT